MDAALLLLDEIERVEQRSIAWGFVDGSFSQAEIQEVGGAISSSAEFSKAFVWLLDHAFLFEVGAIGAEIRYRSRFAESIRLLSQLRQLFPKRPISTAPRLVSDFRIDVRQRTFPLRETSPTESLKRLEEAPIPISPLRRSVWSAITKGLTLAGFQERACERVLSSTDGDGTIITAGTGSGKTLSFYLPALMRIAEKSVENQSWVKCISIYPRRELLKDQFAEVFSQVRKLDALLVEEKRPRLRIGALFGDTPRDVDDMKSKWGRNPSGFVFTGMRCQRPNCESFLIWPLDDVTLGHECLRCSSQTCDFVVPKGLIALTRASLIDRPPDILFTTTEMLNQRLADPKMHRLFGISVPNAQKPLFALLDEVHTYQEVHGAQSALTLRRFKHRLGRSIPFVGLSATLAQADTFFADLVGLPVSRVIEITPFESELIRKGAEYQVLLSSDPSAATLSTTIQSAMLLGRVVDNPGHAVSEGVYGQRVFVFTDDLDATNRLFDNLKDAEGYDIFGHPDPTRAPLAALRDRRASSTSDDANGQRWRLCETLNRSLSQRLQLGRTTSQDSGVASEADVVVATASLEVGYNDPFVGVVLQHKAPRNAASFLQRKGRAGRTREMRPMTVTVLSEYGRDRVSFQAYEHLFDPFLPPQRLPIRNDFILRMQAVYSLIDFLSFKTINASKAWLWAALSFKSTNFSTARSAVIAVLDKLLDGDSEVLQELVSWLSGALSIDEDATVRLLWQPPRSVMLEVIPTLHRRLIRNWQLATGLGDDAQVNWHPLPDFIPQSLFGELNVPEVEIRLPPATKNADSHSEYVPIERALAQFAPGNVSRRFAVERGALSHWFPLPWGQEEQSIQLSDYSSECEDLGIFGDGDHAISVFRPLKICLSRLKKNEVSPTSRSRFVWRSDFHERGDRLTIDIPDRSVWNARLGSLHFYLHKFRGAVLVRRYAGEFIAELRKTSERSVTRGHFVTADNKPAAVGFEFEADAFSFDVTLPAHDDLTISLLSPRLLASCKIAYFHACILDDEFLPFQATPFHRDWLYRVLLSATLRRSSLTSEPILEAMRACVADRSILREALTILLHNPTHDDHIVDDTRDLRSVDLETPQAGVVEPADLGNKLFKAIDALIGRDDVCERLLELASQIANPSPRPWANWLHDSLLDSIAAASLQACIMLAPREVSTDTLNVDIQRHADGRCQVWITEGTIGGAGVAQSIADILASDPRAFTRALESVLAPTELELASLGLDQYLALSALSPEVASAADRLRSAVSHSDLYSAGAALREALSKEGLDVSRTLNISLQARIFRPGSSKALEDALRLLLEKWSALESKLQIAITAREFAFVASADSNLVSTVLQLFPQSVKPTGEVVDAIFSLLWPRDDEIRQRVLQVYSRYRGTAFTDPALIRELIVDANMVNVDIDDVEWMLKLSSALGEHGAAMLTTESELGRLRSRLVEAISTPVSVAFLRFYPMIERIERSGKTFKATLVIREQF